MNSVGRFSIPVVDQQVVEKTFHPAQNPCLRRLFHAFVVQVCQKRFDVLLAHLFRPDTEFAVHIAGHLPQIPQVGLGRIVRKFFFQFDIKGVIFQLFIPISHDLCLFSVKITIFVK